MVKHFASNVWQGNPFVRNTVECAINALIEVISESITLSFRRLSDRTLVTVPGSGTAVGDDFSSLFTIAQWLLSRRK